MAKQVEPIRLSVADLLPSDVLLHNGRGEILLSCRRIYADKLPRIERVDPKADYGLCLRVLARHRVYDIGGSRRQRAFTQRAFTLASCFVLRSTPGTEYCKVLDMLVDLVLMRWPDVKFALDKVYVHQQHKVAN